MKSDTAGSWHAWCWPVRRRWWCLRSGTLSVLLTESGQKASNIHGLGDAAFFTAVQLLTVSSSMPNPVTTAGKVVDVGLELWAIFVVTAVAGSFSSFFSSGDS